MVYWGEDMGIPARNSHQSTKEANYHTKAKCKKISLLGDMFFLIHTTPMFVDGMHVKASLSNPCIRVYC